MGKVERNMIQFRSPSYAVMENVGVMKVNRLILNNVKVLKIPTLLCARNGVIKVVHTITCTLTHILSFLILLPLSKVVAVRRGRDVTGVASVEYKTFEMTATAGEDFKPAQGQLIFPSGVLEQVIQVI